MDRIIMHWSAGSHTVSALDRKHYHFIVDGEGEVHTGDHAVEDNISTAGGYAAHTAMCNTGSIGVSMAAMAGAIESPFNAGSAPISEIQLRAFARLVAGLAEKYGIPITRKTVLSHAEVQPTLGIKQAGKWDIAWLPGMVKPGDPVAVGDTIRAMVAESKGEAYTPTSSALDWPLLRQGSKGSDVRELQLKLMLLGYDLGASGADGDFGAATHKAVLKFQNDNKLDADGLVGNDTRDALSGG